jgi:hypothetical protein
MKAYWTIDQGKRDEAGRRVSAVHAISEHLRQYARSKGGRFLLYGSTARGETRFDSDIDLLLDFAADLEAEAWRFAEEVCAAHTWSRYQAARVVCAAARGTGHNAGSGARMSDARWIEVSVFTRVFRNPACTRNNRFCPIDGITLKPR